MSDPSQPPVDAQTMGELMVWQLGLPTPELVLYLQQVHVGLVQRAKDAMTFDDARPYYAAARQVAHQVDIIKAMNEPEPALH